MLTRSLFKLNQYFGSGSLREKKSLAKDMQWWPRERVLDWQWTKVKELLEHAQNSVPYYQNLFKELKLDVNDIRSWDDFARLPILTKEDIQKNTDLFLAKGAKAVESRTSGSTGHALRFYRDREYLEWAHVSLSWGFNLCGFNGWEKQVYLWGSDYDIRPHETFRGRLVDWVKNVRYVDAFNITDQQLKKLAQDLNLNPPEYIWGYVSTLELLAGQVLKDGIKLHPKAIQVTAGTLYPGIRQKLEQAFGKVVYDRYGSREVSLMAHECSVHQGLHEASFHNHLEIIGGDDDKPGKIVVTNLHNKAFPFIRYEIGDLGIGSTETCPCGRTFPLINRLVGRTNEVFTSPSGKLIDGGFFMIVFFKVEGIKRFQVVQETPCLLVIRIVKAEDFKEDVLTFLEREIKLHGDPQFEIKFEIVDEIPDLSSGKHAYVLSKVPVKLA